MDLHCVLCDQPTGLRALGALVVTGNVEHPDGDVVCRRCRALPARDQQRLRDAAMTRMLSAQGRMPGTSTRTR